MPPGGRKWHGCTSLIAPKRVCWHTLPQFQIGRGAMIPEQPVSARSAETGPSPRSGLLRRLLVRRPPGGWNVWVYAALGVVALAAVLTALDAGKIADALRTADYRIVLVAVLLRQFNVLVNAWRWQTLLSPIMHVQWRKLVETLLVSNLFRSIMPPGAGAVTRFVYLMNIQDQLRAAPVVATMFAEKICTVMSMLSIGAVLLPLMWVMGSFENLPDAYETGMQTAAVGLAAMFVMSLLGLSLLIICRPIILRILGHFENHPRRPVRRVCRLANDFFTGLDALRSWRLAAPLYLRSYLLWLSTSAMWILGVYAIGQQGHFDNFGQMTAIIVAAMIVVHALNVLPIGPIAHASVSGSILAPLLAGVGADPEAGVAMTIIMSSVVNWLPMVAIGLTVLWGRSAINAVRAFRKRALPDDD